MNKMKRPKSVPDRLWSFHLVHILRLSHFSPFADAGRKAIVKQKDIVHFFATQAYPIILSALTSIGTILKRPYLGEHAISTLLLSFQPLVPQCTILVLPCIDDGIAVLKRDLNYVVRCLHDVNETAPYGFFRGQAGVLAHCARLALSNLTKALPEKPVQMSDKDWNILQSYKDKAPK